MKIDKDFYKRVKKLNREEMKQLFDAQFKSGFAAGAESANNADFRIKLSKVLNNTKGIGTKLFDAVMRKAKEFENDD